MMALPRNIQMTKIRLLSDLHLEGFPFDYIHRGEDILVLAGDIHTKGRHSILLDQVPESVKVLLVAGNHEFYGSYYQDAIRDLVSLETKYPNVFFLNNSTFETQDLMFYGGTMFSDFALFPNSLKSTIQANVAMSINDFYQIRKKTDDGLNAFWKTDDHLMEHKKFKKGLSKFLTKKNGKKKIVISHFMPSPRLIDDKFSGSILNAYFCSDMSRYMGFGGYWFYGHTHSSGDIMIRDTRVIGNPRGYGDENKEGFDPNLIIEA